MKCSLLSLSTYIDGELTPDRRAELDAHMVGCPRCSSGASTLREEKLRISQLARVRVPSPSAQMMLEQVGITGVTVLRQPQRPVVQEPAAPALPWHDTSRRAAALPWAPTRPLVTPTVAAPPLFPVAAPSPPAAPVPSSAPSPSPDIQPGLPLDEGPLAGAALPEAPGVDDVAVDRPVVESVPTEPEPVAAAAVVGAAAPIDEEAAYESERAYAETVADEDSIPPEAWTLLESDETADDVEVAGLRQHEVVSRLEDVGPAPTPSWEAALPAPIDDEAPPQQWTEPAVAAMERPSPSLPVAPPTGAPQKLAPAGPAAVWTRLRDAVAVRFALASGRDVAGDGVEIVTGPAPRRGDSMSERTISNDEAVAAPLHLDQVVIAGDQPEEPVAALVHGSDQDAGAAVSSWDRAAIDEAAPGASAPPPREPEPEPTRGRPSWNAFAASSYDDEEKHGATTETPRSRPLGRHSRALARDTRALGARISAAVAAAAAVLPFGRSAAADTGTRAPRGARPVIPRRVMTLGIPAVAVVFLLALVIGHVATPSPHVTSVTASLAPTAAALAPAAPSAPTASAPAASSAPAATTAPAPVAAQSFGGGGTGFQIQRIRYGQQTGFFRTVFDIGAASGTVSGTPKVDLVIPDAKTILLTFSGTVAAGSTGSPGGSTIASVALVSSSGGKVQYRITLNQPATPNAFYLDGPTRFVLDLH